MAAQDEGHRPRSVVRAGQRISSFGVAFSSLSLLLFSLAGYLLYSYPDASGLARATLSFLCAISCGFIGSIDKFEYLKASCLWNRGENSRNGESD
jgi:hypothetical protein